MKIRNGFVSNSSSSSFLVFFPKEVKSKEELKDMLHFDGIKTSYGFEDPSKKVIKKYQNFVQNYNKMNMSFEDFKDKASEVIFKDMKEQGPSNYLYALSHIVGEGWFDENKIYHIYNKSYSSIEELKLDIQKNKDIQNQLDNFDWDKRQSEDYTKLENEIDPILEAVEEELNEIEELHKKHKGIFYSFHFSDESGNFWSALEHGDIFKNYPCFMESHH